MKKNRRIILTAVGVAILAALALIALIGKRAPPEPVYQGKTLSQWLEVYDAGNTNSSTQAIQETDNAIQQMGTNSIPTLLRMLESHDSKLKLWAVYMARRQHLIEIRFVPEVDRYLRVMEAFNTLGSQAQSAVPELIRIYDQNPPASPQANVAALALAAIGPPANAAVPSLLRRATNTNYRIDVHANAINALANIHSEPDLTVPVLAQALQDPDSNVQIFAVRGLGNYGPKAKAAVPALIGFIQTNAPATTTGRPPSKMVYDLGLRSLRQIDPAAAAKFVTNTAPAGR